MRLLKSLGYLDKGKGRESMMYIVVQGYTGYNIPTIEDTGGIYFRRKWLP